MLLSLGLIVLIGLSVADICKKIKLPRIIGMLATGIVLGPYVLDLLAPDILTISTDLRTIALIIILIKAGLSLNLKDLKQVGRPAILMSFMPACFEILAYLIFAPIIFGISKTDALLMGSVLAAVSPAVVIPQMVKLIETNYGTKKSVPQLILAGASLDDVFVIVLFGAFLGLSEGEALNISIFTEIPISIITGVITGIVIGLVLSLFLEFKYAKGRMIKNSTKVIIILGISFLLISTEDLIPVAFSGLLAVVAMACTLKIKCTSSVTVRLTQKFSKLWIFAEVMLFVLVGACVDITYLFKNGLNAILMIFIALIIRSIGVSICLIGTKLNAKERIFCIIAYLPKATVQAAIGAIPLSMGIASGSLILSVAVLAIIITAPLGALGMETSYTKLLEK